MATNFIVILFQRQHFGNEQGTFNDIEPNVPFVGPTKDFSFNCPNVDPGESAFLMFQSRDVDHQRNVFQINGVDVFGGLPASPSRDTWNGNILLIEPRHQLRATGNVLHVESRNSSGGGGGNIDDFIIDNVVIVYKTRVDEVIDSMGWVYNVRHYGAVGDGVTDDQPAIRLAIDAAATTGGTIYFPRGTYIVGRNEPNSSFLLDRSAEGRLVFMGDGEASVIKNKPTTMPTDGDWFTFHCTTNTNDILFTNLKLDGNKAAHTNPQEQMHLIRGYKTVRLTVQNCTFESANGDGIQFFGEPSARATECSFLFNRFFNCGRSGIGMQRSSRRTNIIGNFFRDNADQAIDFEPTGGDSVDDCVIAFNHILHSTGTVALTLSNSNHVSCYANKVYGGSVQAVNLKEAEFIGNYVNVLGAGLPGVPAVHFIRGFNKVKIVGNHLVARTDAAALAIAINNAIVPDRAIVEGNYFEGATGVNLVDCNHAIVTGNFCKDNAPTPIGVGISYTVTVAGTKEHVDISHNHTEGFVNGIAVATSAGLINHVTVAFNTTQFVGTNNIVLTPAAFSLNGAIVTGNRGTPGKTSMNFLGVAGRYICVGGSANTNGVGEYLVTGTPEGVITAGIGSTATRTDGGAGTTLYVKESGTGNTGWVAK